MGTRGPAPKPTALRLIEGNRGMKPLPENEPVPRRVIHLPPCPDSLDGPGAEMWERMGEILVRLCVLTEADLPGLEDLCGCWAMVKLLEDDIAEKGMTQIIVDGQDNNKEVARPQVGMLKEARQSFKRWCEQFGLTPAARTRVQTVGEGKKEEGKKRNYFA